MNFIEASDQHPEFATEFPSFVEKIKQIFESRGDPRLPRRSAPGGGARPHRER